jgi:hypothetical protein
LFVEYNNKTEAFKRVALEGSLRDFGLADILQLIFFQRKTGVLTIEGRMDRVRLLFIDGNIVSAESKRRIEANRLGKVLVKKGFLDEKDLQAVLDEQKNTNVRLGNLLVRKGFVSKKTVEDILTQQIKETVIQIFNWKEGTYEFTPQAVPIDKDIPMQLDTQHLLMEGLRIVDEWTLIEGKITLDSVFIKKSAPAEELPEEETEILALVDGENDVSTIIDISAKDDFSVSKTLVSLMEKGVIELKEALPFVTEEPILKTKKAIFLHRFLPALAIAISIILAIISVFSTTGDVLKTFSASKTISNIRFSIDAYKFEYNSYPKTIAMITKKTDPWGNPFLYEQTGYSFIVISAGADGIKGTADDIY